MSQPIIPPPASDLGAYTVPRYLQRWLDNNPITRLTRTSTYITVPTFAQNASTWNGYSDIVFSWNFEAPNNFSLKPFTAPSSPNYTLCIAYRVGGTVTRYILWDGTGSNLNQGWVPIYSGQPILKNFRLEVWNTSQGIASESAGMNLETSVLGLYDYRWGSDGALVGNDGEVSDFSAGLTTAIMVGSGAGNTAVNVDFFPSATLNDGKPQYYDATGTIHLYWKGSQSLWRVESPSITYYYSNQNVATPDLITAWTYLDTPPGPTFTLKDGSSLPLVFPSNSVSTTN